MIRFKTFSIEEKLLVQAVLSDFFNSVMSVGVVAMTWNLRSLAPDNSDVKALQDFVSYVGDLQVELGVELAIAGIIIGLVPLVIALITFVLVFIFFLFYLIFALFFMVGCAGAMV